jgi:hypothetical protein
MMDKTRRRFTTKDTKVTKKDELQKSLMRCEAHRTLHLSLLLVSLVVKMIFWVQFLAVIEY